MKQSTLALFFFTISFFSFAQNPDDILGKWKSAHGNGIIQINKHGDHYVGKLTWILEPNDESGKPKLDEHNPSKELQTQPILGLEVLKHFSYKGDNNWGGGKIYDPKKGNTYNGQISLVDGNKLIIRAYFGTPILGRTEIWTREE